MKTNNFGRLKKVNALIMAAFVLTLFVSCGKSKNNRTTTDSNAVVPAGTFPNYSINQKIDLVLKNYKCPSGYRELSVVRFQGLSGQRINNYSISGNNSSQVSIGLNYDMDVIVINNQGQYYDAFFYMCDNFSNGQNGNLHNRIIVNSGQMLEERTTSSLNNKCSVNQVSSFAVRAQTSMGEMALAFFQIDMVTNIPGVCEGNTGGYYPYHY